MKKALWVMGCLFLPVCLLAQAAAPQNPPAQAPPAAAPAVESDKVVVPAETTIPVTLVSPVNSRTAHVGQAVYAETVFPITVGNRIAIPVGSSVKGAITQVVHPGRVKGRAQIGIRFETLILPNGTTRSVRGILSGFSGTGDEGFKQKEGKIEGKSTKGEDAGKVAQTTMTGAEIGTITGAVKGSPGKGLGIGSLAGAAGGLIWVLASKGKEIVLPTGTSLELQLTQPLTFERDEVGGPSPYSAGPALPRREVQPNP